ncbi:hypothetical protein O6B97_03130 [Campylobacter ureolyticus]|uniref:hypothetical protein n=1 Tax=Campylobacter ureolyticus TaxID=827 RepID=UPI0022B3400E|nr:hypothetical protein [Campylobacter ureolyticus]MCZ6173407.1 hypothetical protein [Campylobacter ureolyticus]MCZ6186084.1 hypothetical protein [Campylobacter ureolyticus]
MPNEKFQISLNNKRIFLVKVQVIIFLVGMAFAMCFGGLDCVDSYNDNKIGVFDFLIGSFFEAIFYKIYIIFLSLILFCKLFYFKNLEQIKKYLLILFLNIFPFYLFILTNKTPYDSPYLIIIVYLICIFIYAISIYLMYKFYKSIDEIFLFKSFIFINILEIYMLILYSVEILNSLSKLGIIFIEQTFVFVLVMLIFWFTLPLSIWLSIPINLIKEYRYFKKELNISK